MSELAVIFKELNMLVVEQGTIVDRIDYNCEQSAIKMERAVQHLGRANEYQKRSRLTLCILLLIVMIVVFFIALMAKMGGGNRKQKRFSDCEGTSCNNRDDRDNLLSALLDMAAAGAALHWQPTHTLF